MQPGGDGSYAICRYSMVFYTSKYDYITKIKMHLSKKMRVHL